MQKRKGIQLFLVVLITGCATPAQRFQHHIDYLASDRLEGRGIGSSGLDRAADYIAEQFGREGLEPGGDQATYFQSFPFTFRRELRGESKLTISGASDALREGRDFMPFDFSSDEAFTGDVVFCGFGIVSADNNYDDFKGVDLQGKVAMIFEGEPGSWTEKNNGAPTRFSLLRDKIYNAKDRGAAAVLFVNRASAHGEPDQLTEFNSEHADEYGIPAMHVSRQLAAGMFARAGLGDLDEIQRRLDTGTSSSAVMPHIAASGQASFRRSAATIKNVIGIRRGQGAHADEWIVIGAHYDHLGIRKPMTRKFQAGKLVREDLPPQVHNGADDNASGVAGVIEIARLFRRNAPDRSVLFIAFTGEEAGLHGSKHFVDHPTVPLDHIVAMLNMDMIGRLNPTVAMGTGASRTSSVVTADNPHRANPHMTQGTSSSNPHASQSASASSGVVGLAPGDGRVQVFGTDCGTGFHDMVTSEAALLGLVIAPGVDEGGRSDHASFLRKQIPSLHFFSGNHPDYHQPTDDAWKINADGGSRIATLVYRVATDLANQPQRPQFQIVKRDQTPAGGVTSFRVVMGLTPSYVNDDKPGMGVDAVSPQGPADIAGLKAGDRIIAISAKKVSNVYDYMAATRDNKPGDSVEVSILRAGEEKKLSVVLSGAK